jgi:hypothetical protein
MCEMTVAQIKQPTMQILALLLSFWYTTLRNFHNNTNTPQRHYIGHTALHSSFI